MKDIYVAEGQEATAAPAPQPTPTHHTHTKAQVMEMVNRVLKLAGETKRTASWGAYCVLPEKRFISEQDDEEVILLLRAHPITNLGWMLLAILMLLLPGILDYVGLFEMAEARFVFVGKLFWYLMTLGIAFEKFLNWYYSVFIVTNERLVDIDFVNLLYRVVSMATLNHIEEPSMVAGGFVRSIFRYGDVHVATAAERGQVEALAVPYPEKVIRIISELSEELEKRRERGE